MRGSGILMHISSLPGNTGIGTLGKSAYDFVDFLNEAGQKYWQVLPVCPVGFGYSPYQSYSTFAGNPYFIDFDMLFEEGLLKKSDYGHLLQKEESDRVDFDSLEDRILVLRKAFLNFKNADHTEFHKFENENEIWISNYAMYMAAKVLSKDKPWQEWEEGLKRRDSHTLWEFKTENSDEVFFWMFVQFEFFKQWNALKEYANENGIKIIGDIPIYVSLDSADVWVSPDLFALSENLEMISSAGCPPDAFSADGQMWGNPVYRWDRHKELGYSWWVARMRMAFNTYDVVRLDHFRGFESYFSIPADAENAKYGEWIKGPGMDLFEALRKELGELPVIAEDLGLLTPEVFKLLENTGFPGMKVLEFAFSPDCESCYLPHNHIKNSVVYPGTHDNNTIKGWSEEISDEEMEFCMKYLNIQSQDKIVDSVICAALSSVADTAVIQMQDYLGLGSSARMNTPSTVGGNWEWRVKSSDLSKELSVKIRELTKLYYR